MFGTAIASLLASLSPPCQASQLSVQVPVPNIAEATGQHTAEVKLTNRGRTVCSLFGYPAVVFLDRRGTRLPFVITHRGDQMVTARAPTRVTLPTGQAAFVALNKYRCDRGDLRMTKTLKLAMRGATLRNRMPRAVDFAFCGRGDPGSIVSVSPFEPSFRAALRH